MRPTKRFPYPGQYAPSAGGSAQGPTLHTIWKIGGVPMKIYETADKSERDQVLMELEQAASGSVRSHGHRSPQDRTQTAPLGRSVEQGAAAPLCGRRGGD